jgi:fructosamine-3-kinase
MQAAPQGDVSWSVLSRIAGSWAGDAEELAAVRPLLGGCINTVLELLMKDGQKAVLKICPHRVTQAYAHEAAQLQLLRTLGLPVPRVYECQVGSLDDPFSYILMEHLPGMDLGAAKRACTPEQFDQLQSHLAELVLAMHAHTADAYGRVQHADPAAAPETAAATATGTCWSSFFAAVHEPTLRDIEKSPLLPPRCRRHLRKIHQKLERTLPDGDRPRLVHWDLWSTNLLAAPDAAGHWRITGILDPNCKYAHPEADLAYLDLFHTATPAFFHTYQQQRKLPPEYHRVRKPVYQLYTLVNHVHLFGAAYVKPVMAAVDRVTALV